jgi:hypothetical protein
MFEAWGRTLYRRRRLTLAVTLMLVAVAAPATARPFGPAGYSNHAARE